MAEKPNAYVPKNPGDIIRSSDWNELQIKAREEIRAHKHTGNEDGTQIPRTGIEANAIDGSLIDPKADVIVNTLTTNANLTVKGELSIKNTAILSNIQDLLEKVKSLETSKVNRGAGGDSIQGTLNVKALIIDGNKPVPSNIVDLVDSKVNRAGDTITGNLGIGTAGVTAQKLIVQGNWNTGKDANSGMGFAGQLAIKGNAAQLDFIDTDNTDWAIHVNSNKMYFIREPWTYDSLILDGNGKVGIGIDSPSEKLEVTGRIKAGRLTIGAWPANANFDFIGTTALDQTNAANYALLQSAVGGDIGHTFLNSPFAIHLRIGNTERITIDANAVNIAGNLEVKGSITPSAGKSELNGIMFPNNAFGGGGDAAWIRYYARAGEDCTLEIGTSNDPQDHIALMPSGNVGIGINAPIAKLDIAQAGRTATHPATIKGLYVTGDFSEADGAEFRHSNGSQGIGLGYNTLYAAGSNPNQNLQLKPKGTGVLRILGVANITNGNNVATTNGYMSSGSLTIGSIDVNYGGSSGWTGNTAGLLLETLANTEIAVHDSGQRVASLMYFEGDNVNRITIGRDMGWGLSAVNIAGNLNVTGRLTGNIDYLVSSAGNYKLIQQTDANLVTYINGGGPIWSSFNGRVSDINLKKNLNPINNALKKILSLRGVSFEWKDENMGKKREMGVIAQEVEKVFPELVSTIADRKLVSYDGLISALIEAIKEQQTQIDALTAAVKI